ncbi:unnamed protein product [Tuber melanosporum]|uniref:(Perigord truffle) hypothetical protein n=1 Tax=Tuber melanosporum (strain Mel28) TaxID=656061 RepID=D5G7L9_TUBMM|nr:uncharacterized protein GSTUM_00004615001 [Tuber melanosporum]CAZ80512.1 unnamed protein product [Tuber melanosporum]
MVYHKPRKSCLGCRRRHLKCELEEGSSSCSWCTERGLECVKDPEARDKHLSSQTAKDGAIVLNGSTSAYGGLQLGESSFLPADGPSANRVLCLRQELGLQHKHPASWTEERDPDHELRLDKPVLDYLRQLYFTRVHPYIPIITQTYLDDPVTRPGQLLLSAMYGVAAKLPGVIVSTRDFLHIKRVFEHQLKKLTANYVPSLQACQALTLIHLTLEMQCEGLEGVETWPLRLASAVRMALELKLHDQSKYPPSPPYMAELHRRLFWVLFTKDRWTSTGKGYPLMLDIADIRTSLPTAKDLDDDSNGSANNDTPAAHEFFLELVHQALVLGAIHPICFRADRYAHVTAAQFRKIEAEVDALGSRLHSSKLSPTAQAHLELNYTAIRLLFYGPFFKPSSDAEATLFSSFIPDIASARLHLANGAVHALGFASKELLYTGPSIWSILFYAIVRCFLVALSIMHDPIGGYSPQLRNAAAEAVAKVSDIARFMCEERRWCFMVLSGTLMLFTKRVAEDKDTIRKIKGSREASPVAAAAREQGRKRKAVVEEEVTRVKKPVKGEAGSRARGVIPGEAMTGVQAAIMPQQVGSGTAPAAAAGGMAGMARIQVSPGEFTEFGNWGLGNEYSEEIDWREWDTLFSSITK